MREFHGTPIYQSGDHNNPLFSQFTDKSYSESGVVESLKSDQLVLLTGLSMPEASGIFQELVTNFNLNDSYEVQMKFVVHLLEGRDAVDDIAVTVNKRGDYQIIQAHSEGDSSSPLDLFAIYCSRNSEHGGENIFSLANQQADHSQLRAKEKFIVGDNIEQADMKAIQRQHRNVKGQLPCVPNDAVSLMQTDSCQLVVAPQPLTAQTSKINHKPVVTYWDT